MVGSSVCETAFAKINLHLKVGNKRSDGYHEIESLFQQISIADYISVSFAESFSVESVNFKLPAENTLKKAYEVFCEASGFQKAVKVLLVKGIPSGAGLGGASADAVALLKALNRLSGVGFSELELEKLALKVGSDCPFFVKGGTCFVSGRGENLERICGTMGLGLAVFPQVESKTREAYALLDNARRLVKKTSETCFAFGDRNELLHKYKTVPFSAWAYGKEFFTNDFEKVIFQNQPKVAKAKTAMLKVGADFALMSGSGSVVFGLFEKAENLQRSKTLLEKEYRFCEPFIFV